MKIKRLSAVAMLAAALVATQATANFSFTFGSEKCRPGAGGSCHAVETVQQVEFFLNPGQTIDQIDALNENITLSAGMDIKPFTFIRYR